jgi:hypothetical protein
LADRPTFQKDLPPAFPIDAGDLLASPQIHDGPGPLRSLDPERNPLTGTAAVETEHQAGPFGRAAMHEGINAQRPVRPGQARFDTLAKIEAGPPHQRAIAEDPKIFVGCEEVVIHHRTLSACSGKVDIVFDKIMRNRKMKWSRP